MTKAALAMGRNTVCGLTDQWYRKRKEVPWIVCWFKMNINHWNLLWILTGKTFLWSNNTIISKKCPNHFCAYSLMLCLDVMKSKSQSGWRFSSSSSVSISQEDFLINAYQDASPTAQRQIFSLFANDFTKDELLTMYLAWSDDPSTVKCMCDKTYRHCWLLYMLVLV